MATLVFDASGVGALAAVVRDGAVAAVRRTDAARGVAAALPMMAADLLRETEAPTLVACVVGPGSFTGIRAALALAHGLGLALPAPVVGVAVGEALRADSFSLPDTLAGRAVWAAVAARRGMLFLDCNQSEGSGLSEPVLLDIQGLPAPDGPVAIVGDAAKEVAAALAARGFDTMLLDRRRPSPLGIAAAAERRQAGLLPPRPAQPLYAEPPMARALPSRPPPADPRPADAGNL